MQQKFEVHRTVSSGTGTSTGTDVRKGRSRLPALPFLLVGGVLFLFVLSACQVAVAEDGSINIKPESTAGAPGTNSQNTAGSGATGSTVSGNTLAGLLSQTGEVDPTTVSPIDPDQVYEWNGVIEWADVAGGHFIVDRGCDNWAVIPENDQIYGRLKELVGEKGTIWGTVNFDKRIYGSRAINATTAFAPGEVRPLIAVPQIPCDDVPTPGGRIVVKHSEVTLHGDLIWRGGRLWLTTPRGNVRLELPQPVFDSLPDLELPSAGEDLSITLGEYGVVGMWDLANTGLVVKVRDIEEWPHRTFVHDRCGDGIHHFVVGDEQLAAHGSLIVNDGQWLLRTKSGVIFVHRNSASAGDVLVDPVTGETGAFAPDVLRMHEVVVIGDWKTDGNELHMEGDKFVRVKTVCKPPEPPRQPILPGEIAALGTLVFENGRPFLNTPSGRIVLLTRNDVAGAEPQPADPSFFEDIAPEARDAAGGAAVGEDGTVYPDSSDPNRPDIARPTRHILVVGKWLLYRDHLAIVVRYAVPWPYPYTRQIDPLPLPLPQPLPPIFGFPVDPTSSDDIDVLKPDFGGLPSGFEGDVVIIEPEDKPRRQPVTTRPGSANSADGVSVNSFSPASVK